MMKRVVLLFFSLCLYVTSLAQFSDSVHYYVKYGSTGSINKTNDGTAYLLNNNLGFKISKKKITLNTSASYIYGKQNHALTNNDVSAALDFSVNTGSDRFYYWGLTTYDRSYSLKINDRFQAGAGVAYDVIKRENAFLNLSDGLLFETSNLYLHDTIPDVYQTLRNSFRLSYKWVIKKMIVFEGANYFQNSFMNGNDYIIKCNNSMSVKLRSWLSITAALTYNKLNRTERENLLMNYGLTVEKFF
ncbi:DUF481 domain-containing protein [Chitinophaga silvatica]|uniref:DUF481 domain-containing protein n=1 Tax=Chitinophaga silvatica TaxID=2282649 RepID=A0A3E1Y5I2_9BACT|nr:DUF481 domain-containing protein [Chitinophaga silvatica]RFS19985.1 DUF481 domain-containing protein [Chitinophaga silvatica]